MQQNVAGINRKPIGYHSNVWCLLASTQWIIHIHAQN